MELRPIFFTMPPRQVPYPYILINTWSPNLGYISRFRKQIKFVIVDSGVSIFKRGFKEYPDGAKVQIKRQIILYEKIKRYRIPNILITIPDYPDDYIPRSLWLSDTITNIERTHNNIIMAVDNYPELPWLIPVQGHYKSPRSILRAIDLLRESGILKRYKYYGIANLCEEEDVNIIRQTLAIAARELKGKWIHSFGVTLDSLRQIAGYIDSFDSTAWTKPHSRKLTPEDVNYSAKSDFQRLLFFFSWYLRYLQIVREVATGYTSLEVFI